jgi:hypothetical protein
MPAADFYQLVQLTVPPCGSVGDFHLPSECTLPGAHKKTSRHG